MAKHREAPEIAAFVKRMFRALERRAEGGDIEALEALVGLAADLQASTQRAGDAAWRGGYSFTQLAGALGVSRQAARQRFGRKV